MEVITAILEELKMVCDQINDKEYNRIVSALQQDSTFYFSGEGRSGLVAKAIAMRLMHAGKRVHVIGEATTPAIAAEDVLILMSGSGKSNQTVHIGESASNIGAEVFLVTANKEAMLKPWCSSGLYIPAATKYRLPDEPETIQPLGNQFDQAAHIILDAAIIESIESQHALKEMKRRHSNLE